MMYDDTDAKKGANEPASFLKHPKLCTYLYIANSSGQNNIFLDVPQVKHAFSLLSIIRAAY